MCGRFGLEYGSDFYPRFLLKNLLPPFPTNLNISPSTQVPIIYRRGGENILESMKWGLIPFWSKDPKIGNKMFNARIETIREKPSFKKSFQNKRCLVPASNFYEWKDEDGKKIPYSFTLPGEKYFAMAGIYEIWTAPDGSITPTFTILTTQPNDYVKPIHDRMPVILDKDEEAGWLSENSDSEGLIEIGLTPPTAKLLATRLQKI
jgi:putative SOS response-associated peptidase YedK